MSGLLSGPQPPTGVTAVQTGPTSITVTWTPPSPLGDITGYRISYTGGGSSGSETVSGGSTNSYTLTGLTNGQTYTISIVATSSGLSSAPVQATVGLGMSYHTNVGVSVYARMQEHHKQRINLCVCVCVCQQEAAGHRQSKQVNYIQGSLRKKEELP